ncbi:MAG: hypothetical protein AB1778_08230 [Candidatus Bipolaricaulota bacterium]
MKDMIARRLALVALAGFAVWAAAGCVPTARVNVTGGWSATLTFTNGPMAGFQRGFTLDLADSEGVVTGTVRLPSHGGLTYLIQVTYGRVRGEALFLEAAGTDDQIAPPAAITLTLDGEISAAGITGIGTQTVNGTPYDFTWQAVLVAPPPPEA